MNKSSQPDASRIDLAVAPFEPIKTAILSFGTLGSACRIVVREASFFSIPCISLNECYDECTRKNCSN